MRVTLENKTKLITLGFAIGVAIAIFAIIIPASNYISKLNAETSELKKYLERKYESSMRLRSSIKKAVNVQQETENFSIHIYKKGDELKLITLLEDLAATNKVNQRIISTNLDKTENNIVKISLVINGLYLDVLNYLSNLEAATYFFNITELGINPETDKFGDTNKTRRVNLNLDMELYVAK